jgi:hypothetical protein
MQRLCKTAGGTHPHWGPRRLHFGTLASPAHEARRSDCHLVDMPRSALSVWAWPRSTMRLQEGTLGSVNPRRPKGHQRDCLTPRLLTPPRTTHFGYQRRRQALAQTTQMGKRAVLHRCATSPRRGQDVHTHGDRLGRTTAPRLPPGLPPRISPSLRLVWSGRRYRRCFLSQMVPSTSFG